MFKEIVETYIKLISVKFKLLFKTSYLTFEYPKGGEGQMDPSFEALKQSK